MIEFFTRKRLIISILLIFLLSIIIIIIESEMTPQNFVPHSSLMLPNISLHEECGSEDVEILEECKPCSDFERKSESIAVCHDAKYRQKIRCKLSGITFRRCVANGDWTDEKNFILFESMMFLVGVVFSPLTLYRQRFLNNIVLARIQRQVAAGV